MRTSRDVNKVSVYTLLTHQPEQRSTVVSRLRNLGATVLAEGGRGVRFAAVAAVATQALQWDDVRTVDVYRAPELS